MAKRYYYSCPIKALHMMKNFGVEFECPNEDFEDQDDGFTEPYFDFRLLEIEQPETINTLLDMLEDGSRIYVQEKYEHIFEPKEGDFVSNYLHGNKGRHCHGFLGVQSALTKSLTVLTPERCNGKSYFVEDASQITIIMRDNKQFFMPEVEND